MRPLITLIKAVNNRLSNYADDTHLSLSIESNQQGALDAFHNCVNDIANWLNTNSLKFNGNKTEFLCCSANKIAMNHPSNFWPLMNGEELKNSETVHNLGVTFENKLPMESHVNKVAGTCFMLLNGQRKLLPLLPAHAKTLIVCSVILSRLDICNTLLLGVLNCLIIDYTKSRHQLQNRH